MTPVVFPDPVPVSNSVSFLTLLNNCCHNKSSFCSDTATVKVWFRQRKRLYAVKNRVIWSHSKWSVSHRGHTDFNSAVRPGLKKVYSDILTLNFYCVVRKRTCVKIMLGGLITAHVAQGLLDVQNTQIKNMHIQKGWISN